MSRDIQLRADPRFALSNLDADGTAEGFAEAMKLKCAVWRDGGGSWTAYVSHMLDQITAKKELLA